MSDSDIAIAKQQLAKYLQIPPDQVTDEVIEDKLYELQVIALGHDDGLLQEAEGYLNDFAATYPPQSDNRLVFYPNGRRIILV